MFFRCCSFAAAAAISIVDAPAVAADRSATVVAAIDPEFRIQNMKIMTGPIDADHRRQSVSAFSN